MAAKTGLRCLCFLVLALFSLPATAQVKPPIAIEPKVIEKESTATITVTSNGAFDLSRITSRQIRFRKIDHDPSENADIFFRQLNATARKLTLTALPEPHALAGPRLMHIDFGDFIVSLKFTLAPAFVCPASCQLPRKCVNKVCVLPKGSTCTPACRAPARCNEVSKRCEIPQ